jgi:ssDNA-binding Zn-finger/Zn-ribbon topoisomerase 1
MEKLYLPTSSLNFNNIFSSETISPIAFYLKRNFGYKRFEPVAPNSFQNSILLYSHLPVFEISDNELDNYPMVIEIPKSMVSDKIKSVKYLDGIEIFQAACTIYLNPFEIKVYFQSEKHLSIALLKSEASLETKMVPVYKGCLSVLTNLPDSFKWYDDILDKIYDIDESKVYLEIERDIKINKIKGFAYCYLIGANSNLPFELLELKRTIKDLRNITSGLISIFQSQHNSDSKLNSKKLYNSKEANRKLEEFNLKIRRFITLAEKIDPQNVKKLDFEKVIFRKFGLKEDDFENIVNLLKSYKSSGETLYEHFNRAVQNSSQTVKSSFWISNIENLSLNVNSIFSKYESKGSNFRIDDVESVFSRTEEALSKYEESESTKNVRLGLSQAFAISNLRLTSIFDTQLKGKSEFYQMIINDLLDLQFDNIEHFKSSKADTARTFGKILKEFVEKVQSKDWTKCPERAYINSLLDNIESYQPFDIKSHQGEVLQSFSAFILKGDDLEKLKDSLINNNISDFRIGFGLWGATFGFASIPRTITNNFLTTESVYLRHFFKELFKQVLDYDLASNSPLQLMEKPLSVYKKADTDEGHINSIQKTSITQNSLSIDPVEPPKEPVKLFCPICGSDMVVRAGIHGEFYGCIKYSSTGCKGTRKLNDVSDTSTIQDKLSSIILEYVNRNGHCKTSDLIHSMNVNSLKGYNVRDIETFIKQNLGEELELKKIGNASAICKRDKRSLTLRLE